MGYGRGGGLFSGGGTLTINDTDFFSNFANGNGIGVGFGYGPDSGDGFGSGTGTGGAIHHQGDQNAQLILDPTDYNILDSDGNLQFTGNFAIGGALGLGIGYTDGGVGATGNGIAETLGSGGAIYHLGGDVHTQNTADGVPRRVQRQLGVQHRHRRRRGPQRQSEPRLRHGHG